MTIVSIRGTHGSGKSTIVQKILRHWPNVPVYGDTAQGRVPKPRGYIVTLPKRHLFVIGPYHTQCGGCDAVQPYSLIIDGMEWAESKGYDILLEGALVSSSYGTVGAAMNEYVERGLGQAWFAFLDTPLDLCIERINMRREAKGNFEPVNPHNTTVKFENVARTKDQMARLGSKVGIVDIDHERPVAGVMKLFGVQLRKEPA